jgi:hypothetical protein
MTEERKTFTVGPNIMAQIKEACFHQLSKYSTAEEYKDTAEGILDKYNSAVLRALLRR